MLVECVVSLSVMAMLTAGLAVSQWRTGEFNAIQLARMRCIAAGTAQLDALSARGVPLADEEERRLWPTVTCSIERSEGRGDWASTTLVTVTARATVKGKPVKVSLGRYIPGRRTFP